MKVTKIRVSIGSASVLGLYHGIKFRDPPTTCYLMTYKDGHCIANCSFCPQARESKASMEFLSRISWPTYSFKKFLKSLENLTTSKKFKRICIQSLNYPGNFQDLIEIITEIKKIINCPISVAIPPMSEKQLIKLKELGVNRVGIALDAATPELFEKIKGIAAHCPYTWNSHFQTLKNALKVFSEGFVTTHLIIGLGETIEEVVSLIEQLNHLKIIVSLFAFTPIKGTKLEKREKPDILHFRKVQLARFLIIHQNFTTNDFAFDKTGDIIKFNLNEKELWEIIDKTDAFLTSGCPGCNRPYYTSKPSGPIYNYHRNLKEEEKQEIFSRLKNFVNNQ
ncbi:MAG: radical SAM protein [Promethearchaeota archaeon]